MINRILIFVSLFLSTMAKSEILEVCHSDLNLCTFVESFPGSTGTRIYVPVELYQRFNLADVRATQGLGIYYETYSPAMKVQLKAAAAGSVTQNNEVTLNDLAAMGPAENAVIKDFRDCFVGVFACSATSLSISATGILGYLGAKATCSWTGVQCGMAAITYMEWKKAKTEERRIQAEKEDAASASSGGSSSESPGSWPDREPAVAFEENQTCRQPPTWTGESCYWMRGHTIIYDLTDHHWVPGECLCTGTQGS